MTLKTLSRLGCPNKFAQLLLSTPICLLHWTTDYLSVHCLSSQCTEVSCPVQYSYSHVYMTVAVLLKYKDVFTMHILHIVGTHVHMD